MAQLITWDDAGKRNYETGLDHGVLYVQDTALGTYPEGVAWNGLTAVSEKPEGAEANAVYADNMKYLNLISAENYGFTLEALYYPEEFEACDGVAEAIAGLKVGQQTRKPFGFCYRTLLGNDAAGNSLGYKLHLTYGCIASPSEKSYATVTDSPEAVPFSWEVTTTPVPIAGYLPSAQLVIDSTTATPAKLTALEVILYGTSPSTKGRLPLPAEVITLLT